jgi:uncharacterized YccA/Bax inhibitor family protein
MPDIFRTSNPALNPKALQGRTLVGGEAMTLQGTVNKTGVLLLLATVTAAWTWGLARSGTPDAALPWMMGGVIGGLVMALVTIFKKEWSPFTAPLYAALEGLALGGISSYLDQAYHGIAMQAVGLTFGVLAVMLFLYTAGIVRATPRFTLGVIAATGGIFVVYMVDMVLGFFGHHVPLLYDSGPLGIGISLVIVIVASLNLIIDFGMIESGVQAGAPKYMEWYGAFGLMVTLVWLYMEMVRLLSKMRRR